MDAKHMLLNVIKTTAFLIVLWSIFLFALPIVISIAEIAVGVQRFPPQPLLATPLLFGTTLLTLWAAFSFVLSGFGTPMTVDPPRRLVTSGPYAYLRHPFVLGVVGQIVALGIALGSVPVIAYAGVLLIVWYYGIRPGEERALRGRFGDEALAYFHNVRGFRPRTTPYRGAETSRRT